MAYGTYIMHKEHILHSYGTYIILAEHTFGVSLYGMRTTAGDGGGERKREIEQELVACVITVCPSATPYLFRV